MSYAVFLQLFDDSLQNRVDVGIARPGADHKVITDRSFFPDVKLLDAIGFDIVGDGHDSLGFFSGGHR